MNIAMFVPLGFFLGLALPRRSWWVALFVVPGFSGGIELTQGLALSERVSTFQDLAANTSGGYVGLLMAMIMRAMIYARDRTKIERELWERRVAAAQLQRRHAAAPVPENPDPITRLLDPDFWNSDDAPIVKFPLQGQ
jgi:hypothetical protein